MRAKPVTEFKRRKNYEILLTNNVRIITETTVTEKI